MPVENQKRDLVVTGVVNAPIGQVWQAWSDPEQVRRWWGPTGFTCPLARIDLREGGTSLVAMRSPAGQDLYNTWAYHSIVPHQRLEFIQNFADQDGIRSPRPAEEPSRRPDPARSHPDTTYGDARPATGRRTPVTASQRYVLAGPSA